MNVTIELFNASSDDVLPPEQDFQLWTTTAMAAVAGEASSDLPDSSELSIRLINEAESASLNESYRQKSGPTNILSFPFTGVNGSDISLLGDIAICAPLVKKEAAEQDKSEEAHWAHLTIHGVLHLNGYDHEDPASAEEMEALEIRIMNTLGYDDPYSCK